MVRSQAPWHNLGSTVVLPFSTLLWSNDGDPALPLTEHQIVWVHACLNVVNKTQLIFYRHRERVAISVDSWNRLKTYSLYCRRARIFTLTGSQLSLIRLRYFVVFVKLAVGGCYYFSTSKQPAHRPMIPFPLKRDCRKVRDGTSS